MKFGKQIQKSQLEIPEYAASFVDYKALKKLIKTLSATPVLIANDDPARSQALDPREALQANKATFFFRIERELEKVNKFYLQKEAELKLRFNSLLDQKRSMQAQQTPASRSSSRYIALEEGFHQFSRDLSKLQQFIEVNATAFSKILKKWDKTSKSETKVVFLSRAVEIQPCFNRDVIRDLSDQATANLLDFAAWAEGERITFTTKEEDPKARSLLQEESELDSQVLQAAAAGNLGVLQDWVARMPTDGKPRITRVFLSIADEAPEQTLQLLLATGLVDLSEIDEINHRNILHKAAISGRLLLLNIGLQGKVDVRAVDVYGRIPLHYACMHGSVDMIQGLINAFPASIECKDHDRFTPLIHAIVHEKVDCVRVLLEYHANINPESERDHIPLNLACQHGSRSVVKLLLDHHARILSDAEGLYPQHLVARSPKAPHLLRMLKDYGADLDQKDKLYQWTPLFHASSEGNVECLRALLHCDVNVRILDEKGLSALYYATWEGHIECIRLLISANVPSPAIPAQMSPPRPPTLGMPPQAATPRAMSRDFDGIPQLTLPPAIIPIRRYGHNFLESKTFVILDFGTFGQDAIQFYDDNKYPAARITVTSRSSDLIPRNLLLPIQDDSKTISFQIDNLETFAIEFDVYATFGARVIARSAASSKVFTSQSGSSGQWHLELLDPRLRAVGRISFSFLVIKPFTGIPLEIPNFATYWKATGQAAESKTSPFIMGSSLSGDYVRLFVQLTRDKTPVFYPRWTVSHHGLDVPVMRLTLAQFRAIGAARSPAGSARADDGSLPALHRRLASSFTTLREALEELPAEINVELHALYPSRDEEEARGLGPTPSINDFADALLGVAFEHARRARAGEGYTPSVVFSSYNREVCTALNWKQPNYPVLLCNDLGADAVSTKAVPSSGGGMLSVKEAVNVAKGNNFMGLICRQRLLALAPPLVDSIKAAGLVLVSDVSGSPADVDGVRSYAGRMAVSDRVDGVVRANGVLTFMDSVDV